METPTTWPPAAYSINEAAARLRVSRSQIYKLIREDAIRTVKIGDRRIVPAGEVDRLIAQGTDPE